MTNSTYNTLVQAIKERRQIHADYQGHHRKMCPHAIGTTKGVARVLSYQFEGTSQRGLPTEGQWRCMEVAKLSNVSIHDGKWHTGHSHTKPQTCIGEIDVEVAH